MHRILSLLMENEPGALSRVVGLFSQRGYNIESLNVAPTQDASLSRLTLITEGDDQKIEQITKHLNRLIDVVKVSNFSQTEHVAREMLMVKVHADSSDMRDEVKRCCDIFRGHIVDVDPAYFILQLVGTSDKLDAFLRALGDATIMEIVRSGACAMARGEQCLL